jgi:hypothetical protein
MDYIKVFRSNKDNFDEDKIVKEALQCIETFADSFNREDIVTMDTCLHFPHYILSGNEMICWQKSGHITKKFFEDLKSNGFDRTVIREIEVILVSENKVHLRYCYDRIHTNGSIMSSHDNVWILTKVDNRWGIILRSY